MKSLTKKLLILILLISLPTIIGWIFIEPKYDEECFLFFTVVFFTGIILLLVIFTSLYVISSEKGDSLRLIHDIS